MTLFDDIIISTDLEHYADIAKQIVGISVDIRPVEFAQDSSPDIDWVRDIVYRWGLVMRTRSLFLRLTSPLRDKDFILFSLRKISAKLVIISTHYAAVVLISILRVVSYRWRPHAALSIFIKMMFPLFKSERDLPKVYKQTASLEIAGAD